MAILGPVFWSKNMWHHFLHLTGILTNRTKNAQTDAVEDGYGKWRRRNTTCSHRAAAACVHQSAAVVEKKVLDRAPLLHAVITQAHRLIDISLLAWEWLGSMMRWWAGEEREREGVENIRKQRETPVEQFPIGLSPRLYTSHLQACTALSFGSR